MKNKTYVRGALLLVIGFVMLIFIAPHVGCTVWNPQRRALYTQCVNWVMVRRHSLQRALSPKPNTIEVGVQLLTVEIANTPAKITVGLGERDSLGSDGMLFVMPSRSIPTFWMKGMRFDLDFVWIDGNKVVDITQRVQAEPGMPDSRLRLYSPMYPVTHVLEMNAGEVGKRGIHVGDKVTF